jgi:hypothetical protein
MELIFLLNVLVFCAITMEVTWIFYLAVMHLKEEKERLATLGKDFSIGQKIFGYPILFFGLIIDAFLNATAGSIFFLEPPRYDLKEWLFTGRVSRWNDTGGWRGVLNAGSVIRFLIHLRKVDTAVNSESNNK